MDEKIDLSNLFNQSRFEYVENKYCTSFFTGILDNVQLIHVSYELIL